MPGLCHGFLSVLFHSFVSLFSMEYHVTLKMFIVILSLFLALNPISSNVFLKIYLPPLPNSPVLTQSGHTPGALASLMTLFFCLGFFLPLGFCTSCSLLQCSFSNSLYNVKSSFSWITALSQIDPRLSSCLFLWITALSQIDPRQLCYILHTNFHIL